MPEPATSNSFNDQSLVRYPLCGGTGVVAMRLNCAEKAPDLKVARPPQRPRPVCGDVFPNHRPHRIPARNDFPRHRSFNTSSRTTPPHHPPFPVLPFPSLNLTTSIAITDFPRHRPSTSQPHSPVHHRLPTTRPSPKTPPPPPKIRTFFNFFSKFVTKIAYLFNYIYEKNVRLRGHGRQKLAFAAIAGCKLRAPLWNKDSCRQQTRLKMANQSLSSLQLSIFSIFAGRKSPRGAHRQLGPAETRPFQPLFSLQFLHLPFFAGRNCRTTLKLAATPTCRN